MPHDILLFDVDGPLVSHQQPMDKEFRDYFLSLTGKYDTYLVTGNSYRNTESLLGFTPPYAFCDIGQTYYENGILQKELHGNPLPSGIEFYLLDLVRSSFWWENTTIPGFNRHIDWRSPSFVNLAIPGRYAPPSVRKEFSAWDDVSKERPRIKNVIESKYRGVTAYLGGKISLDIITNGADKANAVTHLVDKYKDPRVWFFSDNLSPTGNDYSVVRELENKNVKCEIFEVDSYEKTWNILKNNL